MPEHGSWLTFLLAYMKDTLSRNADALGRSYQGERPDWTSFEPFAAALFVALLLVFLAMGARRRLEDADRAVEPQTTLSLSTFFEVFLGYFYGLAKDVMDEERAKKYFPLIGTSAIFVFTANAMAMIPGAPVATSNLNVTLGCALVVFILFNLYGVMENGWDYVKHLAGPSLVVAPLLLPIEIISLCVRPITLAVRLMLNMAVDHIVLLIFMGLVTVLVPIPLMMLGMLVICVQTLVFTLLTIIYVGLATDHEEAH